MKICAAFSEGRSISGQAAKKHNSPFLKNKPRSSRKDAADILVIDVRDIPVDWLDKLLNLGARVGAESLAARVHELQKENRHLKTLSVTDGLTSLYNKRFFTKQMAVEINRTHRTGEPFCLIFIDLDNFKTVNDTHGHAAGDAFLVRLGSQILGKIRPTDFACRIGGDEFAMILPATTLRDGVRIAGRCLSIVEEAALAVELPVSASIGVDQYEITRTADCAVFLHEVDQLLYRAKKEGKGKIVHPEIALADAASVTREEREVLYHIFRPASSGRRKHAKTG